MASDFDKRLLAARERWVRLDDEREVKIRRPHMTRLPQVETTADMERVCDIVVDWRGPGFTEAGLLGPKLGSDAAVPFAASTFRLVACDRIDWLVKVGEAAAADVAAFQQAEVDAAKK